MTSPSLAPSTNDQVLLALGEIKTTLAVMQNKLEAIPDHETRIRALEKIDVADFENLKREVDTLKAFRYKLIGISSAFSLLLGFAGVAIGHFGL